MIENHLNWYGPVAYDHYANRLSDSLVREDLPTQHEYWLFSPALPALIAKGVSLQVQFDVCFASWNFYSTNDSGKWIKESEVVDCRPRNTIMPTLKQVG